MGQPDSPAANERWLSTHEAAHIIGCHPQTVRDRCARGELPFTIDPATGHRRIPASSLEAVPTARRTPPARGGFQAAVTAELTGALSEVAMQGVADCVLEGLAERDAALTAAAQRLGETRAELRALARARFWQRPRLLARLRAEGLLLPRA